MKTRKVCIKARSPPASLPLKGKVTKHTTVKWAIRHSVLLNFKEWLTDRSHHIIIHDENTHEMNAVKEIWILGLSLHRFWRFYYFVFSSFKGAMSLRFSVFGQNSTSGAPPRGGLKKKERKLGCVSFFNPLFGVWIS